MPVTMCHFLGQNNNVRNYNLSPGIERKFFRHSQLGEERTHSRSFARIVFMKLHPACTVFPKLPDEELRELADDIKANGLQNPIVLLDGKILDGRNRFAACKLAGVEPRFVKWQGSGSPVEWVISQNLVRRHLTPSQRAVIALDILPMLAKEAKERQRNSGGRGKKVAQKSATFSKNGKASEIAARITKANARYVESAKAIGKAAPELLKPIREGGLSLADAKWVSELPEKERKRLLAVTNGNGLDNEAIRRWRDKRRKANKPVKRRLDSVSRLAATTLIHGDSRQRLKEIKSRSVDAIICDPPYPEVNREYGRISEVEWHDYMRVVVAECQRVLKPNGSAVFILQPNAERVGKMRLWLWDFVAWAGREWNLVQDAWWWAVDQIPLGGVNRKQGLMRPSVKMCVWLGDPGCYRNQDKVLWTQSDAVAAKHRSDMALRVGPNGRTYRNSTLIRAGDQRGGTTPFNCLPIPVGGNSGHDHPAVTPYELAAWWCRYILPPKGVLLDPFCGSGTMLVAGLNNDAKKVIGIDKEKKYLTTAKKRITSS